MTESRAWRVHAFEGPEAARLETIDVPEPGPGQVRLRLEVAGVSFLDALVSQGRYQVRPPLPFSPGSEYCARVESVGAGVTRLSPGDRVLGWGLYGAFSERFCVAERGLHRASDAVDPEQAAVLCLPYATAVHALDDRARLRADETVFVLGAAGSVGHASVQVARLMGARVIAGASSAVKRDYALRAGAHAVVDTSQPGWKDVLKEMTGGRGVDVVVDPVGGEATEPAFRALAWEGRLMVVGFAAGSIPALRSNLALLKGAAMMGVDLRQFGEREPERAAANVARVLAWHAEGRIAPEIARRFALGEVEEAIALARSGQVAGRIVIRP